ncbi:hypothetical protein HDU77_005851 [Chytriomyces hyalinus]|nr:hypothetical protein HDU77_005851 [Chytriomyces hyalinus]
MDSFNSTLFNTASKCLEPVVFRVASACGLTISPTRSIAFTPDLKATMKCACTDTQLATVTGAVSTCLQGSTTEATLANAEITSFCRKVNDASSKCSDTINPFGNAILTFLADIRTMGPPVDQFYPPQAALCAKKKDIQAFLTECLNPSPLLNINSVCPAGSSSGSTAAAPVTSTASTSASTTSDTGKRLSSSASTVSMGMLAILAVAALF